MDSLTQNFQNLSLDDDLSIIKDIMIHMVDTITTICNHEVSILAEQFQPQNNYIIEKEPSLKLAHYSCIKRQCAPQVSGNLIERFIIDRYGMIKNNSTMRIGDAQLGGINYEIKASFGGHNRDRFNYVQLRMNHNCAYLLTAYYLCESNIHMFGQLFVFKLNKQQLIPIICTYGSYAHGSKKDLGAITFNSVSEPENKKEYALRVKYNSPCWHELLKFTINLDSDGI